MLIDKYKHSTLQSMSTFSRFYGFYILEKICEIGTFQAIDATSHFPQFRHDGVTFRTITKIPPLTVKGRISTREQILPYFHYQYKKNTKNIQNAA